MLFWQYVIQKRGTFSHRPRVCRKIPLVWAAKYFSFICVFTPRASTLMVCPTFFCRQSNLRSERRQAHAKLWDMIFLQKKDLSLIRFSMLNWTALVRISEWSTPWNRATVFPFWPLKNYFKRWLFTYTKQIYRSPVISSIAFMIETDKVYKLTNKMKKIFIN